MLIAATILTSNRESIIGDAVKSVAPIVDMVIIVDLGITDRTIEITQESIGCRRVRVIPYTLTDSFGEARSFALKCARDAGADWALTLDTDERMVFPDAQAVRDEIIGSSASVLMCADTTGHYAKPRFIRPGCGEWGGKTHEYFIRHTGAQALIRSMKFNELPKTTEQYQARCRVDIEVLKSMEPGPRVYSYLGQSYMGLCEWLLAADAYAACARTSQWDEEAGWAWYCLAQCENNLGEHEAAISSCAEGLTARPAMAELPWFAAWICHSQGQHAKAIYWAQMAAALGAQHRQPDMTPKHGFKYPPAYYESPFDVMRFAYAGLGMGEQVTAMNAEYERLCALREAST